MPLQPIGITAPLIADLDSGGRRLTNLGADGGELGCRWRSFWAIGTAYVPGDVVADGNIYYECILAHTAHEPPNASYWKAMPKNVLIVMGGGTFSNPPLASYNVVRITQPITGSESFTAGGADVWSSDGAVPSGACTAFSLADITDSDSCGADSGGQIVGTNSTNRVSNSHADSGASVLNTAVSCHANSGGTVRGTSSVSLAGVGGNVLNSNNALCVGLGTHVNSANNSVAIGQNIVNTTASCVEIGYDDTTKVRVDSTGLHLLGGGTVANSPSNPTDLVNKNYVDATIQGLQPKPTALVATTAALPSNSYSNGTAGVGATLTASATGTVTVDGHVLALNELVLVKNEATASRNGLYNVTTAGATGVALVLTRHVDMDQAAEFSGAFVPVGNIGTTNANSLWLASPSGTVTVGTTSIPFTQLNGATDLIAGTGITISGNTISIAALGTSAAVVTDGSGNLGVSSTTATELAFVHGVTSAIQTQINTKTPSTRNVNTTSPITGGGDLSADRTLGINAASANTASYVVQRDSSGNFSAGTITAALTGTASGNPPNARLISTSAPLSGGGDLSADRTLTIPKATSSVDGYLAQGDWTTFNSKGAGSVTSVAMTGDGTIFNATVSGSPVTASGTLAPALINQSANTHLAGPSSGVAAAPTFRALVAADIPIGSGILTALVSGSNVTTTGQALVDITGLSLALVANAVYEFEGHLSVASTDANGNEYGVQFSAAGASVEAQFISNNTLSTTLKSGRITALNTATTNVVNGAIDGIVFIKGIFTVGANAGNLTLRHLKNVSGTATVYINSVLTARRIS